MGKGSGKTPEKLKLLLREAVAAESQYAVAKKTGLALSAVQRLLKGDREPSTSTLEKLSAFLNVPVHELRGEPQPLGDMLNRLSDEARNLLLELVKRLSDEEEKCKYLSVLRQIIEHPPSA